MILEVRIDLFCVEKGMNRMVYCTFFIPGFIFRGDFHLLPVLLWQYSSTSLKVLKYCLGSTAVLA